jgi:hypothetical protein
MKKIASTLSLVLLILTFATAQNNKKAPPQYSDDFGKQMEQMTQMMSEQMKKMFGNNDGDSTQNFNFSFKNMPFGSMDSSMTKSFGMLFDGKNWQNLSPNGDSSMNESMKELRERMPDFGKGLNLDDMFKSFGDMFQGGFQMSPNNDNMPRVQPYDKKQKGDEAKKKGKYETEKL